MKEVFEILKSTSATAQERKEAERRIRYVREVKDPLARMLERKFGPLS